jgi:hypothetical protein
LDDGAQRVEVGERALELGVGDRVEVARLVAAGVADGLSALGPISRGRGAKAGASELASDAPHLTRS